MKSWVKFGLIWGLFMCFIMNVALPLWDNEKLILPKLLIAIPIWIIFGLIFGYVSRKKEPKKQV
ncbi:hypothetical protein [Flavobacterium cerinum]|uniref:Group-specific protein n=1 Tax=Flavobacterium cerinum TaxID=2502784 RepID=A0A3S3QEG8_9FLAO|nr:hypothetical protein [Flavobacterium cerinum]RWX02528.1 hypothetical protein EPI11_04735 [Flavobacterium cerinum]